MAQDQGRPLEPFYDIGHGEGLPGARDSQQGNIVHALLQGLAQLVDGFRLVAGRAVCGFYLELHFTLMFERHLPQERTTFWTPFSSFIWEMTLSSSMFEGTETFMDIS